MACHLRDFEDKILLHQFLKSESTNGLSIPVCMYPCMVNSDKQERSRIVQKESSNWMDNRKQAFYENVLPTPNKQKHYDSANLIDKFRNY